MVAQCLLYIIFPGYAIKSNIKNKNKDESKDKRKRKNWDLKKKSFWKNKKEKIKMKKKFKKHFKMISKWLKYPKATFFTSHWHHLIFIH